METKEPIDSIDFGYRILLGFFRYLWVRNHPADQGGDPVVPHPKSPGRSPVEPSKAVTCWPHSAIS